MINFLKGILVGVGGIAPGLSGSVMLLILGLYEKSISAISNIFNGFKNNIKFLFPLVIGFGCGIILFSKLVNFLLLNYEFQTRYAFFGLVIGTIPLFLKSVKKNGFSNKYYLCIGIAFLVGILLFSFNGNLFPQIKNPNIFQSSLLGIAVAGSSIIPGVDSAVILSALGLYELYVSSIAEFNFSVLIPAGIGLIIGAILISKFMNYFITRFYTATFSIIFGLFISIIPKVLTENCHVNSIGDALFALLLAISGFIISFYFGNIQNNNYKIKKIFKNIKSKFS